MGTEEDHLCPQPGKILFPHADNHHAQLAISSESLKSKNPWVWQTHVTTFTWHWHVLRREGHSRRPQLSASCMASATLTYIYIGPCCLTEILWSR